MAQLGQGFDILNAIFAAQQAGEESNKRQLENLMAEEKLQKARLSDPMELVKERLEAAKANQLTNPEYLKWYENGLTGSYKSQDAAGNIAQTLRPFVEQAKQAELETGASKDRLFGNMYKGIETQYDPTKTPEEAIAGSQRAASIADTLSKYDPSTIAKERMLDNKLENNIDLAEMRAAAVREAAEARKKISDPKYKEQQAAHQTIIATVENKIRMNKPVSPEEYENYLNSHRWMQQHQLNLQIGSGRNFTGAPGLEQFGIQRGPSPIEQTQQTAPLPMPGAQQVAPQQSKVIKYDAKGNRIQ